MLDNKQIVSVNSVGEMELLEEDGYGYKLIYTCNVGDSSPINNYVGSLLSPTARKFKEAYIQYKCNEACAITSKCDIEKVTDAIRKDIMNTPFKVIMDMAIDDRIIDSYDDVYE